MSLTQTEFDLNSKALTEAFTIEALIERKIAPTETRILEFDVPPGNIAYNPSKVFYVDGQALIMSRVDDRNDELDSRSWVYNYQEDAGRKLSRFNKLSFPWQDPFATHIQNKLIIGGVKVTRDPNNPSEVLSIATEMMIGNNLDDLEPLCTIEGQKDVRPVDMSNAYRELVGVYGRPQNGHATGDISYTEVETPYQITTEIVKNAPIITKGIFKEGIWCGGNDAIHLSNGHNLVLGHVGRYKLQFPDKKEYHGMHFIHDPITNRIYDLVINGSELDYRTSLDIDPSHQEICFSGGFDEEPDALTLAERLRDIGNLVLKATCGLGDSGAGHGLIRLHAA